MPLVVVKSKLSDSSPKQGKNINISECMKLKQQPVCPKPRRPVSHLPELLRCSKHRNSSSANDMIHNLIESSRAEVKQKNEDQAICAGCSTPYYAGSPPGRTNNPVIYDEEFMNQMEMLSPHTSHKNLQDKSSFTSTSPV